MRFDILPILISILLIFMGVMNFSLGLMKLNIEREIQARFNRIDNISLFLSCLFMCLGIICFGAGVIGIILAVI